MATGSPFSLLTAGARFDKSRFKHDIDLFTKNKSSSSSKRSSNKEKGKGKAIVNDQAIPGSLDFFHDHKNASKSTLEQDEVEEHEDDDEDDEESSIASSSRLTSPPPEPPKQKITISGPDPLPSSISPQLDSLFTHHPKSSLRTILVRALKSAQIHSLWGVQCAVAGSLLTGNDTLCVAPTGSGKTLSYLLPTLVALGEPARSLRGENKGKGIRAVIIVPTYDLAIQIRDVLKVVGRGRAWRFLVLSKATEKAVCDAAPGSKVVADKFRDEEEEEEEEEDDDDDEDVEAGDRLGIDILISTPERLHHLINDSRVSLSETAHLILDETDRLVSADFLPQVEPIVQACSNPNVQKCFLSATMPAGAEQLARTWLRREGVRVVVGLKDSAVTTVDQSLLYTGSENGKLLAVRNMLAEGGLPYPSLIFVQSIARADDLSKSLVLDGIRAHAVHSNMSKTKRDQAIQGFREGSIWILVVTDVLARGMDFRGVKVVVNYDFPQTVQSYIHRIGRTGRAGRPGKAITFFSNEDGPYLRTIANVLAASGCPVPSYALSMPRPSKNMKRKLARAPVKRKEIGGGGRDVAKERAKKKKQMIEASKKKKARVESEEKV